MKKLDTVQLFVVIAQNVVELILWLLRQILLSVQMIKVF